MKIRSTSIWTLLSLSLSFSAIFSGCKDNVDHYVKPSVKISPEVDKRTFVLDAEEKRIDLKIDTNRKWSVLISEDAKEWIAVTPDKGPEGKHSFQLHVLKNESESPREGTITIVASTERFAYSVQQKGSTGIPIQYVSFAELSEMAKDYDQNGKVIEQDLKIRATITTHHSGGNFVFQNFYYMQDEAGNGLVITLGKSDAPMAFGTHFTASLKGSKLKNFNGTIQVESKGSDVVILENKPVAPKKVTIKDILAGKCINQFVTLEGVQFETYEGKTYYQGSYSFNRDNKIQDKQGNVLPVEFYKNCTFGSISLPSGSGSITGIATYSKSTNGQTFHNIRPSVQEDINFKGERFVIDAGK